MELLHSLWSSHSQSTWAHRAALVFLQPSARHQQCAARPRHAAAPLLGAPVYSPPFTYRIRLDAQDEFFVWPVTWYWAWHKSNIVKAVPYPKAKLARGWLEFIRLNCIFWKKSMCCKAKAWGCSIAWSNGARGCAKKIAKHVIWTRRMLWIVVDGRSW